MKNGKYLLGILSVFLVLATLSISVTADGVNQTPEIQGITTTTVIDVVGSASNNVELAWTSGSGSIQDNPPLSGRRIRPDHRIHRKHKCDERAHPVCKGLLGRYR